MNLLLIGCGNIGGALLHIWANLKFLDKMVVIQPSLAAAQQYAKSPNITFVTDLQKVPVDFSADITVLAIKPQLIQQVLSELAPSRHCKFLISLLAGVEVATFNASLPTAKIVRIMPNVAIKTGKSLNLAYATANINESDRNTLQQVFDPTGALIWLDEERMINALTPITGSGAAYFFLLAEILGAETVKLGVDKNIAAELVQQVLVGSASLVESNNNFTELKDSVTSKKGVTEVALKILTPAFQTSMSEAIQGALNRIQELANENRS